jgi:hypothetical protein
MKRRAPKRSAHATDASDYTVLDDSSFFAEPSSRRVRVRADAQPDSVRYMCLQCFATETVRRAREIDRLDRQSELIFGKLHRWSNDSFGWLLAIELSLDGVRPSLDAASCSFCDAAVRRCPGVLKGPS